MILSKKYRCLSGKKYFEKDIQLEPIRFEDRLQIMKWRNEQIYHLRQSEILNINVQNKYFEEVVSKLFDLEKPSQILFSLIHKDECVGYGGLVHIDWVDKRGEISFIMNTELEETKFDFYWSTYLRLIEKVAFIDLKFHKIYTHAFDLRPHLYEILEQCGYTQEAKLKEHCLFDNKYIDVLIHSKFK